LRLREEENKKEPDKIEATEKVPSLLNSVSFFEKSKKDTLFSCKMKILHKSEGLDA
jgi:hypothetical protein